MQPTWRKEALSKKTPGFFSKNLKDSLPNQFVSLLFHPLVMRPMAISSLLQLSPVSSINSSAGTNQQCCRRELLIYPG